MTARVAINGFGRIGEMTLRSFLHQPGQLDVVAINDIAPLDQVEYLLRHDSVHPGPPARIARDAGDLVVDGRRVRILQERDPAELPWDELGIDIAIECTGVFRDREGLSKHLEAGARRVVLSAPAKDDGADTTICMGVNHMQFDPEAHRLVSNASCTTNALAPLVRVLYEAFGWSWGLMSTVHAYTGSQALTDKAAKRVRRGRAAALNIVPTTTGAAKATVEVLPQLEGKIDGMAFRVPVACGSIVDVVFEAERDLTLEAIHDAVRAAADDPSYRGVIGITEAELVSSDIVGDPRSSIVDATSTLVLDRRRAKVLAWYDNEWGYACRVRDLANYIAERIDT